MCAPVANGMCAPLSFMCILFSVGAVDALGSYLGCSMNYEVD